jgi:predicted Zn-dependent peptidase
VTHSARATGIVSSEQLLDGTVCRTVLSSGLRVVTEQVPHVRSAAVGIWLDVGSRDENLAESGASHYLEHLLFKGTPTRSAMDISASLEAVGGDLNAFTSREYTCYYARVLDADLPLAVDVLADMVRSSLLRADDVDAERTVVLEEIAMRDDDPSDLVHDLFGEAVLEDEALARPVLGSVESIQQMPTERIRDYYQRTYCPEAIVVTVAGALDHETTLAAVQRAFAEDSSGVPPHELRSGSGLSSRRGVRLVHQRPTEQTNIVLGTVGIPRRDPRRYALQVLSTALGEGMSSRLFQEVREKRGLAYSVYSFQSHYADTGTFGVYAGCAPQRAVQVIEVCREQVDAILRDGLTPTEIDRAKGQLRGGLVLNLEDTLSRMNRLGRAELAYGELPSVDELLGRINRVTEDDVREIAAEVLDQPLSLVAVGSNDERELQEAVQ